MERWQEQQRDLFKDWLASGENTIPYNPRVAKKCSVVSLGNVAIGRKIVKLKDRDFL